MITSGGVCVAFEAYISVLGDAGEYKTCQK